MAQYQVSVDGEVLQQLSVRDDGVARLAEHVLNQILEAQATEQLRAKPYERSEERQGYRNGHQDRPLNTRVGRIVLSVPRLRNGEFSRTSSAATSGASRRSSWRWWRWW
ncbi:MAG: transposase [Armatimonadota bacterium]|nr:transposase [Armatimonadota bacterium]